MFFSILGKDKNNLYCYDYDNSKYFILDWKYDIHKNKLNLSKSFDINMKKQINRINDMKKYHDIDIKNIIVFGNRIFYVTCSGYYDSNYEHETFLCNEVNKICIKKQINSDTCNNYFFDNYYFSKYSTIIPIFVSDKLVGIHLSDNKNEKLYKYDFSNICDSDILFYKNISKNNFLIVTLEKIIMFNVDEKCISKIKQIHFDQISNNCRNKIIDIVYTNNKLIVFLNKNMYLIICLVQELIHVHKLKNKSQTILKLSDEIILVLCDRIFDDKTEYEIIYLPNINYFNKSNEEYFEKIKDIYLYFQIMIWK